MVYDPYEFQIGRLKMRVKDLEESVASLGEKYLASTNTTIEKLKTRVKDLEETVASLAAMRHFSKKRLLQMVDLREHHVQYRIRDLEKTVASLRERKKYLYNTSSTMSEDTVNMDWDLDYGQQGID